jgi:20S proteasome alpha/beta subunit
MIFIFCTLIPVTSVLGYVDLIGTTFSDNYMSTGYGSHIALPLLRRDWREDMTEAEVHCVNQSI